MSWVEPLAWTLGLSAAAIGLMWLRARPCYYHCRMSLEVETPDGLRVGSSVIRISASYQLVRFTDTALVLSSLRGEAVALRLNDNRTIFATLKKPDATRSLVSVITAALAPEMRYPKGPDVPVRFHNAVWKLARASAIGHGAVLPRADYPVLIWFKDPAQSTSAVALEPDDLAAELGPNHRLKRITLEVTREPVTRHIDELLPSMSPDTGFAVWRTSLPGDDVRRYLARNDFTTEARR
jgi:hypothetical protein